MLAQDVFATCVEFDPRSATAQREDFLQLRAPRTLGARWMPCIETSEVSFSLFWGSQLLVVVSLAAPRLCWMRPCTACSAGRTAGPTAPSSCRPTRSERVPSRSLLSLLMYGAHLTVLSRCP